MPGNLVIPQGMQARIAKELASLPVMSGKIVVTLEFNCSTSRALNVLKIKRYTEEEIRTDF